MKLQKREKGLLIILVAVIIVLLPSVFLIFPAMTANTAKEQTLQTAEALRFDMEVQLATKPLLEESIGAVQQTVAAYEMLIPPPMKTYDIHYFVNDICTKAGVKLDGLVIGDYEPLLSEGESAENTTSIVYHASLNLTLLGSVDQILQVADGFSSHVYTGVSGFYIESFDPTNIVPTSMTVELYTIVQPGDNRFVIPIPVEEAEIIPAEQ